MRTVARWEVKGGKDYLELLEKDGVYSFTGPTSGGVLQPLANDAEAIAAMEAPWGRSTGPVTVLRSDRPSTKRVV